MGPEAVSLMRAIKRRYPEVEAGTQVDPSVAAHDAAFDPDTPAYGAALRELLNEDVLRRSPGYDNLTSTAVNANPHYQVTPEGSHLIATA